MDSYDSNQILIFSGFSRSTRFSHFCTAQISKFQRKTVQFFAGMKMKFHFPFSFFDEFRDFSAKIWWNFAGISQKWLGNDKLSRDFVKKCEKNSEKCQKFPEIVKISIFHSIFPFVSLITFNLIPVLFRGQFFSWYSVFFPQHSHRETIVLSSARALLIKPWF